MSASEMLAQGCLSIPNAVQFSSLSRSTLYEAMEAGELPYVRCEGRRRRIIPKAALVEYLGKGLVAGELVPVGA